MVVKAKYFGLVAEALGKGHEEIEIPGAQMDLRLFFLGLYPQLGNLTWKIAVDQEFVEGMVVLQDRAEVVLLPPFAGG